MSLIFMLFALLGSVVVLGGGSYVLRELLARMEARRSLPDAEPSPRAGPRLQVGGYVPAQREPDELPTDLRERARNLVALGRTDEAIRLIAPRLDGDERRARRLLGRLDGNERPALDP